MYMYMYEVIIYKAVEDILSPPLPPPPPPSLVQLLS